MNCITRVGFFTALGLGLLVGCSKSGSSDGTTASAGGAAVSQTDLSNNPAAKAASDFLDAVLKGDTQRASARLTPEAMQRIVASGKQFSPPGLENATFRIVEVRAPSEDHTVVLCQLTDSSAATPHSEEMCCVLRKVENDWRVCGIAYGSTDKPWTLNDFESGQSRPIPGQSISGGGMAATPGNGGSQSAPGTQVGVASPPVTPPAPVGIPAAGPSNTNSPAGTAGLGMPAVGSPASSPYQPQSPYTAQQPQSSDRR